MWKRKGKLLILGQVSLVSHLLTFMCYCWFYAVLFFLRIFKYLLWEACWDILFVMFASSHVEAQTQLVLKHEALILILIEMLNYRVRRVWLGSFLSCWTSLCDTKFFDRPIITADFRITYWNQRWCKKWHVVLRL